MLPEQILIVVAIAISLIFEYLPWVERWFDNLESDYKRLFMVGAIFAVVAGAYGLSFTGLVEAFEPSWMGAWQALLAFVYALIANQTTHRVLPKGD